MTNRRTVTWLHLSDLHMCSPMTGWDAGQVLRTLTADLGYLHREYGLEPDLLFFTGDLAYGHRGMAPGLSMADQYRAVETFLTDIRNAAPRLIPRDHVFLVPGNHDVDRRLVESEVTKQLGRVRKPGKIHDLLNDRDNPFMRECMKRLDAFHEFLVANRYDHLLSHEHRLVYTHKLQIRDLSIGVAGLNSAWSCGRRKEWGKLWAGGRWQIQTLWPPLEKTDLQIGLIHHPCSGWIREEESEDFKRMIAASFDFFLHGHEHRIHVTATAEGFHQISAGACYQSSRQENAYNIVQVNLDTGRGRIFLRRFEPDGIGWVPRPYFGSTNERGIWPLRASLSRATKRFREKHAGSGRRAIPAKVARPHDQAAAVCYRYTPRGEIELVLIETSEKRRMFPKKYVDLGETFTGAAALAAREEAGVVGDAEEGTLGTFEHDKPEGRVTISTFLMQGDPSGRGTKDPQWYSFEDAERALKRNRDPAEWPALMKILREARKRIPHARGV